MFKSSKIKDPLDYEQRLSDRFAKCGVSEAVVTMEEVLKIKQPTKGYLCPKEANIYGIDFIRFRVRDLSDQKTRKPTASSESNPPPVLIDVARPDNFVETEEDRLDPTSGRFVKYHLHKEFLDFRTLGAQVTFTVGNKFVKKFRMIERHYFKDQLIKSFDFIPNSENTRSKKTLFFICFRI